MSTENTTEEPKKKTIEELILSKPITPEIVNKLFDVYKDEWNKYSDMMTKLLDQSILNDIQDIKVLVDRIDTQPSSEDQFDIKDKLLNDEKKKIFCMWLFKSHILCVNADERIVGRKIEHDLPVIFKIYLNKNLANRINNVSNTTVKIEQYNKAVEKILDQFKTYFNDSDFFFKRIDAATTESNLDSVQICLGFNTYYSEAEHGYIKEFVKEVITDKPKSEESLDQSSELFGHDKKKEEPKQKPVKLSKENALKACKNCTKLLKDAFAKNGNPKGFSIYSESEIKENIDEYLDEDNDNNSVIIGSYDAWEFTNNKARDEKEYKKFDDMLIKVENTIKDLMKQSNCPYNISSDGGDWDDGYYTVYFTQKPNLEHEKSYMGSEESLDQSSESVLALAFILPILSIVARLIAWIILKANVKSYNKTFKKLCEKLNKENAKELETIVKEVSAFVEGFIDRTDIMCKEIFKEDTVAAVYNTINYRDPGRIKSKYASASEKTIKQSDEYKDVVKNVEQNMANFVERLLKFIIVGKPLKLDNDTSIIRVTCVDNGYNMTEQIATKLDKLFDKVFKCTNGKAKFKIHGKDVTFNYRTCIYGNDYSMYSYITLE